MTHPTPRRILPLALPARVPPPLQAADTDPDYPVPDFSLTERSGRTVTKADLLGKVWVASFVLVRCPDGKCPQVTQAMARLQDDFASRKDVVLVTFTVDPDRDTPDELKRYAEAFHADPDKWLFLTGNEDTIDELMRSIYVRAGKGPRRRRNTRCGSSSWTRRASCAARTSA